MQQLTFTLLGDVLDKDRAGCTHARPMRRMGQGHSVLLRP